MTPEELACQQALLLAGPLEEGQELLLKGFCAVGVRWARAQLRPEVDPETCAEALAAAAGLYAIGLFYEVRDADQAEGFSLGDLSVQSRKGASAESLTAQARKILAPYGRDSFAFLGV